MNASTMRMNAGGAPVPAARVNRRWPTAGRCLLLGSAALVLAFILLPLVFVIWLSIFRQEIPTFPPEGYSLRWFGAVFGQESFANGLWLPLQVTAAATVLAMVLGTAASLSMVRFKLPFKAFFNNLLILPMVLPGVVLGAAIYVAEIETETRTELPVMGSFWGLALAHTLVVLPWVVRLIGANLVGLDPSIEEAAKNLGAHPWTVFWRITLPGIRPGLVAAALLGGVTSFGNLEMSLFLVGPGQTTLPIAILQYLQWKIDPTVAAVSVIQIVLIGAALIVSDRFVRLSRVV
jgi:putative spermidine/putrescine transport system permease protein